MQSADVTPQQHIYTYLTNCHNRNSEGIKLKDKGPKIRLYGQDFWARENEADFKARLERHKAENPGFEMSVGVQRSVTGKFFTELPVEVQDAYKTKAKEELRKMNTVTELAGEAKEKYVDLCFTSPHVFEFCSFC